AIFMRLLLDVGTINENASGVLPRLRYPSAPFCQPSESRRRDAPAGSYGSPSVVSDVARIRVAGPCDTRPIVSKTFRTISWRSTDLANRRILSRHAKSRLAP